MCTFQDAFRAGPDCLLWYGWSKRVRKLTEIKTMAEGLRRNQKKN